MPVAFAFAASHMGDIVTMLSLSYKPIPNSCFISLEGLEMALQRSNTLLGALLGRRWRLSRRSDDVYGPVT